MSHRGTITEPASTALQERHLLVGAFPGAMPPLIGWAAAAFVAGADESNPL